ncbi:hypothetical protein HBI56_032300 [Parastagonospora nodorum]|uniref:Uncharacterized protein n=1 Tax=Phaeosphaeria nodorum (strain SN15 / ATCC MYA-4574 / FGSC 10173) TaxID=321614 RepID=A0A7U2EYH8_PHANO|nr:hypothetical protein HBH56_020030 [Parastagonospora nodorum]QRC95395.1 hypothetical protein JI435_407290 [Parastagonospora nodorum SN15]KAH3937190.1 hypothetical protein HBH54_014480 [Parastagonospora nodorum]KAH3953479.1 hypothetical protein HBH53_026640 [Parastagonospora nodorum]KAH3967490.1 hypothetical protein HBH51_138150 [Parastagonospora nodorum]
MLLRGRSRDSACPMAVECSPLLQSILANSGLIVARPHLTSGDRIILHKHVDCLSNLEYSVRWCINCFKT